MHWVKWSLIKDPMLPMNICNLQYPTMQITYCQNIRDCLLTVKDSVIAFEDKHLNGTIEKRIFITVNIGDAKKGNVEETVQ